MIFPLYFTEILAIGAGTTFNCGFKYSIKQIWESAVEFYMPVSIIIVVYLLYIGSKIVRGIYRKEAKLFIKTKNEVLSFAFCEMVCILPAVVIIGRNGGTYHTYYLQLWWLWVILFSAEVVNFGIRFIDDCNNKSMMKMSLYIILIVTIINSGELLISTPLNKNECVDWKYVYSVLDNYSQKGEILISAHLSSWAIDNDIDTSEYGQQEFNNSKNLGLYNNNVLWKKLFPLADDIIIKNMNYNEEIRSNIERQRYTCIALTDYTDYKIEKEFLEKSGYYMLDERKLLTGTWEWNTRIWICD